MAFYFEPFGGSGVPSLDYPVGHGAPNRRDDVMLVQLLLYNAITSSCYEKSPLFHLRHSLDAHVDFARWSHDGVFGHNTARALQNFVLLRAQGLQLEHAGWVLPIQGGMTMSSGFRKDQRNAFLALYRDGNGAFNAVNDSEDVYERLPGIACIGCRPPALLKQALANSRRHVADKWKDLRAGHSRANHSSKRGGLFDI